MGELRGRRWFLGTATAAVPAVLLRPKPHHRRAAYPAAATAEGEAVPVSILSTGTFNAPPPGFPDSTTVGFANAPGYPGGPSDIAGAALTDGSNVVVQSNTTYKYYKNLGYNTGGAFHGMIGTTSAPVTNVTCIGCCWENSTSNGPCLALAATGPVTLSYCTFRPAGLTAPPATYAQGYEYGIAGDGTQAAPGTWNSFAAGPLTVEYSDFWGFAGATTIQKGTQASQRIYRYNYFHDVRVEPAGQDIDHGDGLGCPGGGTESYTQIIGNSFFGYGNPQADDTNALAYQLAGGGNWDHFTITGNLFTGWAKTVCVLNGTLSAPAAPTNITFTGNTFSTISRPIYSPLYSALMSSSASGNLWRNNKWHVPAGAAWGNPAHDGWYWLPVDADIQGTDDTQFVSLTDFAG